MPLDLSFSWDTPKKDPDKMTVGELFGDCVECHSALHHDGSCRMCGQEPPTVQRIEARRKYLKEHPEEEEES